MWQIHAPAAYFSTLVNCRKLRVALCFSRLQPGRRIFAAVPHLRVSLCLPHIRRFAGMSTSRLKRVFPRTEPSSAGLRLRLETASLEERRDFTNLNKAPGRRLCSKKEA